MGPATPRALPSRIVAARSMADRIPAVPADPPHLWSCAPLPADDAYEIAEITSPGEWDGFVALVPDATPFNTSAWLECAAAGGGGPAIAVGCRHKGRLVAGVGGQVVQARGGKQFITPTLLPHGGFLTAPSTSDRPALQEADRSGAYRALIGYLSREFAAVHLTHTPAVLDVREFGWAGWAARPRYTYWIDLADRQAVWDTMERRTRAAIRKARDAGFSLVSLEDDAVLRRLYEAVYERQSGDVPVEAAGVEAVARRARAADLTETWAVEAPDGKLAAAVAFARGESCVYAWIAGAAPEYRDSGATPLLYWEFLQRTEAPCFDFAGANIPAIALFKRGFGGRLVPYFATDGYRTRLRRGLAALRRSLRG